MDELLDMKDRAYKLKIKKEGREKNNDYEFKIDSHRLETFDTHSDSSHGFK